LSVRESDEYTTRIVPMNYGFVIDNRKCIGCHACTVACKSEHDVALGVNRTSVKYIEHGVFPDSVREFFIQRCNHCEAAPCVEICPTSALYTRADGIVDFDNRRCIGCKSCMQACPYDALYIDPVTNTSAKCNYCAHRVDRGREPACVVICPVEAIISGDLDDPDSTIATIVARESVVVRKPEKDTYPNLFYVKNDSSLLSSSASPRRKDYLWSEQATGVGHYAKYAAELPAVDERDLLVRPALESDAGDGTALNPGAIDKVVRENEENRTSRRVYDIPSKGILWGWEVPAYIWTKAIATGTFLVFYLWQMLTGETNPALELKALIATLIFLGLTGGLLVADLNRPDRFLYVLLRPQWSSWLVRGAYLIAGFGFVATLLLLNNLMGWPLQWLAVPGIILSVLGAAYTAFLFAQARGRDLWQSPLSSLHMVVHSLIAGATTIMILNGGSSAFEVGILRYGLFTNVILITLEVMVPHATTDAHKAVKLMTRGYYSGIFYAGMVVGNLVPLVMISLVEGDHYRIMAGVFALLGIFLTEFVRVRVPQLIPLS